MDGRESRYIKEVLDWYGDEDAGDLKRSALNLKGRSEKSNQNIVMNEEFVENIVMSEEFVKNSVMNAKIVPTVVMELSIF